MGGMLAITGSAVVVALSWAPYATQVDSEHLRRSGERVTRVWTVWSDLALTGPLRAAVGLSALAALLCLAGLVLGGRFGGRTVLNRIVVFASGSSATILACYLLAHKYTYFEPSNERHEPQTGWGAFAMFAAAWIAFAAILWNSLLEPNRREPGTVLGDVLVFLGTAIAVFGSTLPFLTTSDSFALLWFSPLTYSAWGWNTFTAPLTSSVVVALGLAAGLGILRLVRPAAARSLWQVYLAVYAVVVMVGYALSAKYPVFGDNPEGQGDVAEVFGLSFGIGAWMMLVGSLVAMAGAIVAFLTPHPPQAPDLEPDDALRQMPRSPGRPAEPNGVPLPTARELAAR